MSGPVSVNRNWLIRVLSLLLAIVIWLFVDLEQEDMEELTARVRVENLPTSMSIAGGQLPAVRVQVRGPKILLIRYQGLSPVIPLDCGGVREGITRFVGAEQGVRVPAGISLVRVVPATIELKFQKRDKGGKRE